MRAPRSPISPAPLRRSARRALSYVHVVHPPTSVGFLHSGRASIVGRAVHKEEGGTTETTTDRGRIGTVLWFLVGGLQGVRIRPRGAATCHEPEVERGWGMASWEGMGMGMASCAGMASCVAMASCVSMCTRPVVLSSRHRRYPRCCTMRLSLWINVQMWAT